jgi:SAM-dependent methyltransferase
VARRAQLTGRGDRVVTAADHWRDALARWAIPDHVLTSAPANPHGFSVRRFTELADEALRQPPTPTHARAAERLPQDGSVLDVGCGGGAGSLPLRDRAGLVIGADESAAMLRAFATGAARAGIAAQTVEGRWPDAADAAPVADVVVCLHVVYNVADLAPFVQALSDHARHRVVLEFPTEHPLAWLRPYWRAIHDVERPDGPTGDDALAVFAEAGHPAQHHRWRRVNSLHLAGPDEQIAFVCQRLAVGDDRRPEVAALIAEHGVPTERPVITAWWDVD